jgi:hypothetical protein
MTPLEFLCRLKNDLTDDPSDRYYTLIELDEMTKPTVSLTSLLPVRESLLGMLENDTWMYNIINKRFNELLNITESTPQESKFLGGVRNLDL